VAVGVIPDDEPGRLKRRGKLRSDTIGDAHAAATLKEASSPVKATERVARPALVRAVG
jgi:hypothetical protein